jgi:hypothetical protein
MNFSEYKPFNKQRSGILTKIIDILRVKKANKQKNNLYKNNQLHSRLFCGIMRQALYSQHLIENDEFYNMPSKTC